MDSEVSECNGESLQTVRVEYDEDEKIDVKYEDFDSDSELESNDVCDPFLGPQASSSKINEIRGIQESDIVRCDWDCVTCQKHVQKIKMHLKSNFCPSLKDVMSVTVRTEAPEYIVDPNSVVKTEPEDGFVKSEPFDDDNNARQRPGTHDSVNSGQKKYKVYKFDTRVCNQDCQICKEHLEELRNHLGINHPQPQFQPGCDDDLIDLGADSTNDPLSEQSTVHGPLKTVKYRNTPRPRQVGNSVSGKYILNVLLTPDRTKQNLSEGTKRKTRTSKRAGYPEEAIAKQPGSFEPIEKKSRSNSNRRGHDQIAAIHSVETESTRRTHGVNSGSKSQGKSSNQIQEKLDNLESISNSFIPRCEKVVCSASREEELTEHAPSRNGGNLEGTDGIHTLKPAERTLAVRKSVRIAHAVAESPEITRFGEKPVEVTHTAANSMEYGHLKSTSCTGTNHYTAIHTGEKRRIGRTCVPNSESPNEDINVGVSSIITVYDSTTNSVDVDQGHITNAIPGHCNVIREHSLNEVGHTVNSDIDSTPADDYLLQQNGRSDFQNQVTGIRTTTNQLASNNQPGNEQTTSLTPILYPVIPEHLKNVYPVYENGKLIHFVVVEPSSSLRSNPVRIQQSEIAEVNQSSMELENIADNSSIPSNQQDTLVDEQMLPLQISQPSTSAAVTSSVASMAVSPVTCESENPTSVGKKKMSAHDQYRSSFARILKSRPDKYKKKISESTIASFFNDYTNYNFVNNKLLKYYGYAGKFVCGICAHLHTPIQRNPEEPFHVFTAKNSFETHFKRSHSELSACGACTDTFATPKKLAAHILSLCKNKNKPGHKEHLKFREEEGTLTEKRLAEGTKRQKRVARKPRSNAKRTTTIVENADRECSGVESAQDQLKGNPPKKGKKQTKTRRKSGSTEESGDSEYSDMDYSEEEDVKKPQKGGEKKRLQTTTKQTTNRRKVAVIDDSEDSENSNVDDSQEESSNLTRKSRKLK